MSNIKFVYLYRDGANYKSWDDIVFTNPDQLAIEEIEDRLNAAFLVDRLFIAYQILIPEKFPYLDGKFTSFDHCYHEFDDDESCKEKPTDKLNRSISDFLNDVELIAQQGWKEFDILDRA
jgi:hypothetical protein